MIYGTFCPLLYKKSICKKMWLKDFGNADVSSSGSRSSCCSKHGCEKQASQKAKSTENVEFTGRRKRHGG